ncbi:DMT family transporter [Acidihalobacter prosperus]|uniref:QacE family quaternary ammonium compound efflux SMR transporter n=1 Tax=Acidihalobacter prosperus TaxID=160660 RepID=A0A1A6C3Z6_9GAMM|nr:multidrug efflux SMR transporter [Acidihalobacter prosperus]OBS09283.1 QacE family quaternary ammonium compound efflux SMR transporter [Acidihalobacter prosperus]
MAYVYLMVAILSEVVATTALKAAAGFTRPLPSLIVVIGYGTAFYCLSQVLRSLPVSITYAIWSGLGIVLVTLAGAVVYRQVPDGPAWIGMGLIVAGVLVINLYSRTVVHP